MNLTCIFLFFLLPIGFGTAVEPIRTVSSLLASTCQATEVVKLRHPVTTLEAQIQALLYTYAKCSRKPFLS